MKKVLFATTALVASAGFASADVAISGSAEMGVVGGDNMETQFHQDLDVSFTMSGETDSGITFGAAVDLDEVQGGAGNNSFDDNGTVVFISGDFGTLTMGDTDGGFDAGMQEVNIGSPGSIDDSETAHAGYNGNNGLDGTYDGQVLSYAYSVSGFTITGSVEMDDTNTNTADAVYGIGASYGGTFGGGSYTVGAGYQATADSDGATAGDQDLAAYGISATVALDSGLSAGVNFSMIERGSVEGMHAAIGASYAFGDITVHANYGEFDWDAAAMTEDASGFGLAAAYDLGGGLSAHVAYGMSDYGNQNAATTATSDRDTFSLGLAMSF